MPPEWGTRGVVFPGPPEVPVVPVPAAQSVPWVAAWFDAYNQAPAATNPGGPSAIDAQFAAVNSYAASSGHKVYNGEWAAQDGGDTASRVAWMKMVRKQSEANGVGWCVWDQSSPGMKLLDPAAGTWDEELLSALFD
jgi:hypothetical protein